MRSQWMSAILLAAAMTRPVLARPASVPAAVSADQPAEEVVQLDLPPGVTFEVGDLSAGAVTAHSPFLVAIRNARLAPGKALRISVSLDAAAPPGTRVSFQPGNSHGGTCRAGSLLPGASVQMFETAGGAVTASCELRWSLDSLAHPPQAGSIPLTLHWRLESVAAGSSAEARASAAAGGAAMSGILSVGSDRPHTPAAAIAPAGERRPRDLDRPERSEPPPLS